MIAAGSRPGRPRRPVARVRTSPFHTSDTVMRHRRAARAPGRSSAAGYIAAEMAHVFASFGVAVTWSRARARCCAHHDADIVRALHRARPAPVRRAAGRRRRRRERTRRRRRGRPRAGPTARHVEADVLLVAIGRRPQHRPARPGGRRRRGPRRRAGRRRRATSGPRPTASWPSATSRSRAPAQARRQPRGPGRRAQPRCTRTTPRSHADHRFVPARRVHHPQVAAVGLTEERGRARRASLRRQRCRTTATSPTAGRWRTPPASARCSPTRRPGCCSARTSSGPQAPRR